MPRLFVAIDIPEDIVQSLVAIRDPSLGVRWTPEEQFHLTLRFIGNVPDNEVERIDKALSQLDHPRFRMRGSRPTAFPSLRRPRVLVLPVDGGRALTVLQQSVDEALQNAGVAPDPKPFRPHVTLGRVKDAAAEEIRAYLQARLSFILSEFQVTGYHLYQSRLHPSAAVHSRVRSYELLDLRLKKQPP